MTASGLIVLLAVALALWMAVAWTVVVRSGKSGWVDVFWSYGIGIAGAVAALVPITAFPVPSARALIVALLVVIWSLRLGSYILVRTLKGGDDPRYAQLSKDWGAQFPMKLLGFLEIQALAALILVGSIMAAAHNPSPLGWGDALGVLIVFAAIAGEGLSDRQMRLFKAKPQNKGKVCDEGLWGLSRHPNYFFEWLAWVGYVPIGVSLAGSYPWGWGTLVAPLLMYWLLVRVSGIPPLEAHMLRSRPEAFRAYQARVRAFWPIPKSPTASESAK